MISRSFILVLALLATALEARAQDPALAQYYRLYLHDKGTPFHALHPGDPLYDAAAARLTPRALARRAKVLPPQSLVTTDDLPIFGPYMAAITATGATVAQTSRWLNTVMVLADSGAHEQLRSLGFLDSMRTVHAHMVPPDPFGKTQPPASRLSTLPDPNAACIEDAYGAAWTQNHAVGIDAAHEMGIAGEGVLVGVLDAGFDWRTHNALMNLDVIGEFDFVNNDSSAADLEGESAEEHGTACMSMIGGLYAGHLVGGAPHASYILAKTEDVRSERNVEEDNFVAGLEWVESFGADVTSTSLGYTEFDAPELRHEYSELNGHTAQASRGLNHAVGLGMICVVAAGNEGAKGYRYVSVPGEADSSICVAAVDSNGKIASFSSRGLPGRATLKPDVAAMGVGNWGANHNAPDALLTGQGTSYATPMTTAVITLLLSVRPGLRPWEVRSLLYSTADHALDPDTAYGHGVINCARALSALSRTAPVVGYPRAALVNGELMIAAGLRFEGGIPRSRSETADPPTYYLDLDVRRIGSAASVTLGTQQPFIGVGRWQMPSSIGGTQLTAADRLELVFRSHADASLLRRDTIALDGVDFSYLRGKTTGEPDFAYHSVLCESLSVPSTFVADAVPNPFTVSSVIRFHTGTPGNVSLILYNALGEEMVRLIDGVQYPSGVHTAFFQPDGLPSGSYYYILRAGDAVASGALVYLH